MVSRLRQITHTDDPGQSLHLGKITRVTSKGAFVKVNAVAPGFEFGPCRYPLEYADPGETAGNHTHAAPGGVTGTAGAHSHPATPLAAGDTVLCGFLDGGRDDLVVIVRLT